MFLNIKRGTYACDIEDNIWTKVEEITGGWRNLRNAELHDLYSSPRRERLAGRIVE